MNTQQLIDDLMMLKFFIENEPDRVDEFLDDIINELQIHNDKPSQT